MAEKRQVDESSNKKWFNGENIKPVPESEGKKVPDSKGGADDGLVSPWSHAGGDVQAERSATEADQMRRFVVVVVVLAVPFFILLGYVGSLYLILSQHYLEAAIAAPINTGVLVYVLRRIVIYYFPNPPRTPTTNMRK